MFLRILAISFLWIGSANLANAFTVAGWDVQPVLSEGEFLGCTMAADYEGGTRAGLMVLPGGVWAIMMSNRTWNVRKGYTTPATVVVDGRSIGSGTATAFDANLLVLPLQGGRAYEALQSGRGMRVISRAVTVGLSLSGTRPAMDAVWTCVQSYRKPQNSPVVVSPTEPAKNQLAAIPASETLVLASNLLAGAGLSGYRVDPPKDDFVTWTLANGVKGGLMAMRNFQGEPEQGAAELIKTMSANCSGEFVSAKKPTPTVNGMIVRKLVTACIDKGERTEAYITMVQQPGGLLMILFHGGLTGAAEADDQVMSAVLAKPIR